MLFILNKEVEEEVKLLKRESLFILLLAEFISPNLILNLILLIFLFSLFCVFFIVFSLFSFDNHNLLLTILILSLL